MWLSYIIERKVGKENVKNIAGWKQLIVGLVDAVTVFGPIVIVVKLVFG